MRFARVLFLVLLVQVVVGSNNTTELEPVTAQGQGELYGGDDASVPSDEGASKSHAGDVAMAGLSSPEGDTVSNLMSQFSTLINHSQGKRPEISAAMNKLAQTMVIVMKSVVATQNTTSAEHLTTAGILGNMPRKKATPELTEANPDPFNLASLQSQFSDLQTLQGRPSLTTEQQDHAIRLMKELGDGLLRVQSLVEQNTAKAADGETKAAPKAASEMDLAEESVHPKVGEQLLGVMKSLKGQLSRMENMNPKSMKRGLKARLKARMVRTRHLLQEMGVLGKDDSLELPNENGDEAFTHLRQKLKDVVTGLLDAHTILPGREVNEATSVIKKLKDRMDRMEELHGGSDQFASYPKLAKVHREIRKIMDTIAVTGNQLSPQETAALLEKVRVLKQKIIGVSEKEKGHHHHSNGMGSWEKFRTSMHKRVMNVLHEMKSRTSLSEERSETYLDLVKGIQAKLADIKQHGGAPSQSVQHALMDKVMRLEDLAKSDRVRRSHKQARLAIKSDMMDMDEQNGDDTVRAGLNTKLVELRRSVSERTDLSDNAREKAMQLVSNIESKAAVLSDSDLGAVIDKIEQVTPRASSGESAELGESHVDIHALYQRIQGLMAHLDPSKLSPEQAREAIAEVRNIRGKVEALKGDEETSLPSPPESSDAASVPAEESSEGPSSSDDSASALRERVEGIVAHLDPAKLSPQQAQDALATVKKIHAELNALKEGTDGSSGNSDTQSTAQTPSPIAQGMAASAAPPVAAAAGSVENSVRGLIDSVNSDPSMDPEEAREALATVKKMKSQLEGTSGGEGGDDASGNGDGGGISGSTSLEEIHSKVAGLWDKINGDPASISPAEAQEGLKIVKRLRGELRSYADTDLHEEKRHKSRSSDMLQKIQHIITKSMKEIQSGSLSDEEASKALDMVRTLKQKVARLH